MPFLPPYQQHQSTEGKKAEYKEYKTTEMTKSFEINNQKFKIKNTMNSAAKF